MTFLLVDVPEPFNGIIDISKSPFTSGNPFTFDQKFYQPNELFQLTSSVDIPATREYAFLVSYDDTDIDFSSFSETPVRSINNTAGGTDKMIYKKEDGLYSVISSVNSFHPPVNVGNNIALAGTDFFNANPWRPPIPVKDFKELVEVDKLSTQNFQFNTLIHYDVDDEVWKTRGGPTEAQRGRSVSISPTGTTKAWIITTNQTNLTPELDPNVWLLYGSRPSILVSTWFYSRTSYPPFGYRDGVRAKRILNNDVDADSEMIVKSIRTFDRAGISRFSTDTHQIKGIDTCWLASSSPSMSGDMLTAFENYYPLEDRIAVSSPDNSFFDGQKRESGLYYQEGEDLVETGVIRPNIQHTTNNGYVPVISGGTYTFEREIIDEEKHIERSDIRPLGGYGWERAGFIYNNGMLAENLGNVIEVQRHHYGRRKGAVVIPIPNNFDKENPGTCNVKLIAAKWDSSINYYRYTDLASPFPATYDSVNELFKTDEIDLHAIDLEWRKPWSCKKILVIGQITYVPESASESSTTYRWGTWEFTKDSLFKTPYRFDIPRAGWDGFTGIKGKIPEEVTEYYEPTFIKSVYSTIDTPPFLDMDLSEVTNSEDEGGEITIDFETNYLYYLDDASRDNYFGLVRRDTNGLQTQKNLRFQVLGYTTNYISIYDTDTRKNVRFANNTTTMPIPFIDWVTNKPINSLVGSDITTGFPDWNFDGKWEFEGTFPYEEGFGRIYITVVFACLCVDIRYGSRGISISSASYASYRSQPSITNPEYVKWKKTWIFDKVKKTFTEGPSNLDATQPWKNE